MTHHNDPFEYSEYKRNEHKVDWMDIIMLTTLGALIAWIIIRAIFTV